MRAPLVVPIEARQLSLTDWVEGEGIPWHIGHPKGVVMVLFEESDRVYSPDERLFVRLEDYGEEGQ